MARAAALIHPSSSDTSARINTTRAPADILAEGIAVEFIVDRERHRVLQDIDLSVAKGSFVSLIGPSGCGKSTLLKVLAGLVAPVSGTVTVTGVHPQAAARARKIGLVFQDATLLPWKNAVENAAFLLETADDTIKKSDALAKAADMLSLVGLDGSNTKMPSQLSGGMRQRVSIARALALDPDVLMMDEPFGALDAITREEMGDCLLDIWERTGKTIVLVTHSIDEAIYLSDEVHVMGGTPAHIIETLPIELPHPRSEECHSDPKFTAAEAHLRGLLIESRKRGRP